MLLQKPRSPLETYNDLDGNVVNFFRVLRDRPDELIRKIRLTPWARAEYELSLQPAADEVERARRFYCASVMGMNGITNTNNKHLLHFRVSKGLDKDTDRYPPDDLEDLNKLSIIAERLRGVQVECATYHEIINRYDRHNTLIYFDPPYSQNTDRTKTECYAFEWTDTDHLEAATLLRQAAGYVIVSGYACPLYADLYEAHGWQRHDKEAQTNSGGKRIESVWLSPRTVEALARPRQAALW